MIGFLPNNVSTMKNILLSLFGILLALQLGNAQELSSDLTVFVSQVEGRYESQGRSTASYNFALSYLDTLSTKFDFKIGLGYQVNFDSYANLTAVDRIESGDTVALNFILYDRYRAHYMSARLGVKYWFNSARKGLYLVSEALPHYLVASQRKEEQTDEFGLIFTTQTDPSDTYTSFNVVWLNGVGYKLVVGYGLSIHASLHLVTTVGNVLVGLPNGNRVWRGLTLGATYKW